MSLLTGKFFPSFSFFPIANKHNSKYRTKDMGGTTTTQEFTSAILRRMETL